MLIRRKFRTAGDAKVFAIMETAHSRRVCG
jgi:hypothetical protein